MNSPVFTSALVPRAVSWVLACVVALLGLAAWAAAPAGAWSASPPHSNVPGLRTEMGESSASIYSYDNGANFAPHAAVVGGTSGAAERPASAALGAPVALPSELSAPGGASSRGRARLAGEAGSVPGGPTARPDIVLSGGRGGGQVKSLTGPPDSILSGHGGRIYVTDSQGRVVLDITRDRVKPVVPGQGFGGASDLSGQRGVSGLR